MMKNNYILFFCLFILVNTVCSSQDLPKIIPPSPNASTLGEYGNTPISLTIGTPNINIPIWEIKGKHLSLPISLSYRASGIKVEDQGSSIGTGWALNAGGVITRSIRGVPEEGVYNGKIVPNRLEDLPYSSIASDVSELKFYDSRKDSQPDLFYYNFGNYSGKFVFDENANAQIMPDAKFNITFGTSTSVLVVTDTKGVKYYFNDVEGYGANITSWYLSKIISADGSEEISFEYALEQFSYWKPLRSIAYVDGTSTIEENISHENVYISTLRLSKINTNFGVSVDFVSGVNRVDYNIADSSNKPKAISSIEIKYNNLCVKKFKLENEFVETIYPLSSYNYLWSSYDMSWANKRMYLKGITETSCDENISKNYKFEYWGRDNNGKDSLANKMSHAQDHWGYFNGKWNNSLRPSYTGFVPIHKQKGYVEYKTVDGADRSSDFLMGRCGTLKLIVYPTGGKTLFDYEGNYGFHELAGNIEVGGLRISKVTNLDVSGAIVKTNRYEYENGYLAEYPDYTNRDRVFTFPEGSNDLSSFYYTEGFYLSCTLPQEAVKEYKLVIHSGSVNSLGSTNGFHINYKKVKEIEVGNGYVLNEYNSARENFPGDFVDEYFTYEPVQAGNLFQEYYMKQYSELSGSFGFSWITKWGGWPYAPSTDYSWKRGLLKAQYFYKEGASLPEKTIINEYTFYNLNPVYGVVAFKNPACQNTPFNDNSRDDLNFLFYGNYKIQYGVANLTKQTITENGVTKVVLSEYNDSQMLSKTSEISSDNKTLETTYKYPKDFSTQVPYNEMITKNMIAPVIEETRKNDGNLVSKLETAYKKWDTVTIAPEYIKTAKGSNNLENRIQYHSYYDNGNVREISKADGIHEYYIWGYKKSYPIAKIENFTASQATAIQSIIDLAVNASDADVSVASENTLRQKLNDIRNNIALSGAMITTYTYDPLIGVTSITDPKGYTTYYEYDEFNRLKQVKDQEGNILSKNEYHYKTE